MEEGVEEAEEGVEEAEETEEARDLLNRKYNFFVLYLAVAVLDARGDEYVEDTEEERALSLSPRPPLLLSPFL